jgi:hypothetical protein
VTGVFHEIALPLPARLTFAVHFVVTNCHGPADLAVEFLDPDDWTLSRGEYQLAVAQGVGGIDGAPVERGGTYRLRITCRGRVLAVQPTIIGVG